MSKTRINPDAVFTRAVSPLADEITRRRAALDRIDMKGLDTPWSPEYAREVISIMWHRGNVTDKKWWMTDPIGRACVVALDGEVEDRLYRYADAANILGIRYEAAYGMVTDKRLVMHRSGGGISARSLFKFMADQIQAGLR